MGGVTEISDGVEELHALEELGEDVDRVVVLVAAFILLN